MLTFLGEQCIRAIPVAKLRAILDDPANKLGDDDLLMVNPVGNLSVLDASFRNTLMWIDIANEICEWEGKES